MYTLIFKRDGLMVNHLHWVVAIYIFCFKMITYNVKVISYDINMITFYSLRVITYNLKTIIYDLKVIN